VIAIVEGEIRPSTYLGKVRGDRWGANVLFLGTVRSPSSGKEVLCIKYEAYREMALREMEDIVKEARSRWDIGEIALVHRTGRLRVGEISLLIAVSSPHREEAFLASRFLIEEMKRRVPVWKKERREDGETWI
jgi:molybdopterin synthase catalytic subunit